VRKFKKEWKWQKEGLTQRIKRTETAGGLGKGGVGWGKKKRVEKKKVKERISDKKPDQGTPLG